MNSNPYQEQVVSLRTSIPSFAYQKALLDHHLNQHIDHYSKHKKVAFANVEFTSQPTGCVKSWMDKQQNEMEKYHRRLFLAYKEQLERQISFLKTILKHNNNNPLLKQFERRLKETSIEWWGIEDKDRNARDGAIDATLLLVEIHWEEWTVFGENACDETVRQKGLDNTVVEHITYEVPQLFK